MWDGKLWHQVSDMGPIGRSYPALSYDSKRGRTVLFGGHDGKTYLGDTWEYFEHS
jgi:hypothetical protein